MKVNSESIVETLSPTQEEIKAIIESLERALPYLISGLVIIALFVLIAYFVRKIFRAVMLKKGSSPLLIEAVSNVVALLILLLGTYLALNSTGMSSLAVTILGGTGFVGIGIGLALKGSIENYVASLMISIRETFRKGELVEIGSVQGYVQSVTSRGTMLIDAEGNHIVIPNSTVFSSTIKNFSRNPNTRCDFIINVGLTEPVAKIRSIIEGILSSLEPVILKKPESLIVVTNMAGSAISIRTYFWINGVVNSKVKTLSLVMERTQTELMAAGIKLSTDSREVTFMNPLEMERTQVEAALSELKTELKERQKTWNEDRVKAYGSSPQKEEPYPTSLNSGSQKIDGGMVDLSNEVKNIQIETDAAEKGENLLDSQKADSQSVDQTDHLQPEQQKPDSSR